jgi:hypothetical protein
MNFERFKVEVSEDWIVTVWHGSDKIGVPRPLARQQAPKRQRWFPFPPAAGPAPAAADLAALCDSQHPERVEQLYDRILSRNLSEGGVRLYGSYLFETLFGLDLWNQIVSQANPDKGIELALKFPARDWDLSRLNWEAMREPKGFLARGVNVGAKIAPVAISRLVAGKTITPRKMRLPPRALFIVGSDLYDQRIRAGAEYLGLLRQLRHPTLPRTFHPAVLINASVLEIQKTMASFQPDLVHFICHGTADGGLEFAPDPDDPAASTRILMPNQVVALLVAPKQGVSLPPPSVVVLNACDTAVVRGTEQNAPLAVELVQNGVPLVIGMAGRVADQACRLFTRTFGEAVFLGRSVVEATEMGRRAAFAGGDDPDTSIDWALSTLFFPEEGVGPDYKAELQQDEALGKLLDRVTESFRGVCAPEPVLAARWKQLQEAYAPLRDGTCGLLTVRGGPGLGKSRFLQELVNLAVQDGHLPVLVSSRYRRIERPTSLATLISTLQEALWNSARFYSAAPPATMQLQQLQAATAGEPAPLLDPDIRAELKPGGQATVPAMVFALRRDLLALLESVRKSASVLVTAASRPMVLLDDADWLGLGLLEELLTSGRALVTQDGLNDRPDPVIPLVLSLGSHTQAQIWFEQIAVWRMWAMNLELKQFDLSVEEDLSAYKQVILNPFNPRLFKDFSRKRWVFMEPDSTSEACDKLKAMLRNWTRAIPGDFDAEPRNPLYMWVEAASSRNDGYVKEANDDEVLEGNREKKK